MKKLFLTLGIACLFMVACNNAPKQDATEEPVAEEVTPAEEEHVCPMAAMKEGLANWENLEAEAQAELINGIKAMFDEMDAAMAEKGCCHHAEGEGECQEMNEEQKAACEAKCAEMKALMEEWANWPEEIEAQKALVEKRLAAMTCCNHKTEGCCHAEAPAEETETPVEE